VESNHDSSREKTLHLSQRKTLEAARRVQEFLNGRSTRLTVAIPVTLLARLDWAVRQPGTHHLIPPVLIHALHEQPEPDRRLAEQASENPDRP
jgi:hypothetical protein